MNLSSLTNDLRLLDEEPKVFTEGGDDEDLDSLCSAQTPKPEKKTKRGRPRIELENDATEAQRRRAQVREAQRYYRLKKDQKVSYLIKRVTEFESFVSSSKCKLSSLYEQVSSAKDAYPNLEYTLGWLLEQLREVVAEMDTFIASSDRTMLQPMARRRSNRQRIVKEPNPAPHFGYQSIQPYQITNSQWPDIPFCQEDINTNNTNNEF